VGYKYMNLDLQVRAVSKFRQNRVMSPAGHRPKKDYSGPATTENYRPNLSSGREPHINKPVNV
jgi:hypothetical protein